MALEGQIQTIITSIAPTATYMLASKFEANLESFHINPDELPLIVLDNELSKNVSIQQNYSVIKETRIVLWFLNQDTPDNTDNQTNAIQNAMELLADRTALQIYNIDNVRPSGNQECKIIKLFNVHNTDLSGVALDIVVNENINITCE
jgi:hypothetical protein